jgi:hypothetical protein
LRDHHVTSLTINGVGSCTRDAGNTRRFCSLIALISGPIQEIEIKGVLDSTSLLRRILRMSPMLKSIRISDYTSCDYPGIVSAYHRGECKATVLDLGGAHMQIDRDGSSLLGFLGALSDQTNVIAATVEQLSVSLGWQRQTENADVFNEEALRAVEKMLASNQTLRVFSLDMKRREVYRMFTPLLLRYHNHYYRTDPLPVDARWAFLSALRRKNGMARLDSYVIAVIFKLAATPNKRLVTLRYWEGEAPLAP